MSTKPPFVSTVELKNYKSIESCKVELSNLAILVGANGSGKSNFLDALRFVAESLRTTMDQALRERGGITEVRRRSRGHPHHFSIALQLRVANSVSDYRFRVGAQPGAGFEIQEESCVIHEEGKPEVRYEVHQGGVVDASFSSAPPPASTDRLYLTQAAGYREFRPIYDAILGMGFYNIDPNQLRDLQDPDPGALLARDGRNVASVLKRLAKDAPTAKDRIEKYLAAIVPGITQVDGVSLGHKETLEFRQNVKGDERPWKFPAQSMSDGTLRAVGVLASLFQSYGRPQGRPLSLVAIEEPEVALHPAAAAFLLDSLLEASETAQVLVTTHSPQLLDSRDLPHESLLIVNAERGTTHIAPADDVSAQAMKDSLYTAGELLNLNALLPRQDEHLQSAPNHQADHPNDSPPSSQTGEGASGEDYPLFKNLP